MKFVGVCGGVGVGVGKGFSVELSAYGKQGILISLPLDLSYLCFQMTAPPSASPATAAIDK